MGEQLVEMLNISKQFDGQLALKNANFSIRKGEVCSILGENAAGKTTLMKILAGVYSQDSGTILFEGREITLGSPIISQKYGIRMIFQEPQLVDFFTVEKNIFIGKEHCYKHLPFINKKYQIGKAREILNYLQAQIDVNTPVEELTFSQKKMVEIAKALLSDVKLLILDEVTASFTDPEIETFIDTINKLKSSGLAIVFISHKLEEVLKVSDRIVIIRDGETVEETTNKQDTDAIIEKMAGVDYLNRYPKSKAKKGRKILELKKVSNSINTVKNVDFYLRSGEIVGIAGLQGAGKTSLARLLAGAEPAASGEIRVYDQPVVFKKPYIAVKKGIAFLSEQNATNLNMMRDTPYNITLSNLNRVMKRQFIIPRLVADITKYYVKHLNIKINDLKAEVRFLSRGTQQKVAISKWLHANANILVMDEPSMNLDINSKVELYNIMNKLSHNGKGIVIASSDLPELIGMCDRIYVLYNGNVVAELCAEEANSIRILKYASGNACGHEPACLDVHNI